MCMYVCVYVCVYMCTYVCVFVYVCMCVCVCVCMDVCMCVCVRVYVCINVCTLPESYKNSSVNTLNFNRYFSAYWVTYNVYCVKHLAIDCGHPEGIKNGGRSVSDGTLMNSVVTYYCNTGYALQGSETRRCASNGRWTGTVPECIGKTPTGKLFYM